MEEYNEKYWSDYTLFIKRVEELTKQSPSNLLEHYASLVEELEEMPEGEGIEWVYEEFLYDIVRQQIQKVLDDSALAYNTLLIGFANQVSEIDKRIQIFLTKEVIENIDWRKRFKIEYIDWVRLGFSK